MNESEDIYSQYGIDKSKLKRDYVTNPLITTKNGRGSEYPEKEDVEYLYNVLGLKRPIICSLFGINNVKLDRALRRYGIVRNNDIRIKQILQTKQMKYGDQNYNNRDKAKSTTLERYGNEYYTKTEEYAEKRIKTNLERYGVENPSTLDCVKNKAKETNLKRYGVDYYTRTDAFKEKLKKTCQERYNADSYRTSEVGRKWFRDYSFNKYGKYYVQTEDFKEKTKKTNLERYGVENPSGLDIINQRRVETSMKRFGVPYKSQDHINPDYLKILNDKALLEQFIKDNQIVNGTHLAQIMNLGNGCTNQYLRKYGLHRLFDYNQSTTEKEIRGYINQYYQTENNRKDLLGNRQEIDIYVPELKLGIEFNGDYWHNEYSHIKSYHQNKSLLAEKKGIFIYHIFEYEWKNKKNQILNQLNNLLGVNQTKIGARKCEIRTVSIDDKRQFLEDNHLQGDDRSSVKLGLYYEDKLVSLMTFCKPRFNKKYEWELSRFCSLAGCNVIGGASKLFNYFVKNYEPKSIISYSNVAHTRGNIYGVLGFKFDSITMPNYVWCSINQSAILSRYQCQKHKLLKQGYKGATEVEIMHNLGYARIYDSGNKIWVWSN